MKKYMCLGLLCFMILCGCHSSPNDTLTIRNNATTPLYGFHIHCIANDKTIEDHVITNADQSYFNEKTMIIDKSDLNQYKDIKVYAIINNQKEIKIYQSSLLLNNYSTISLEGNQKDGFFFIVSNH